MYQYKKPPTHSNLALLVIGLNYGTLGAFSPHTLTQIKIWAHSANIPTSYLLIDTPHAYIWTSWNFHFLMVGSNFEMKIHPAECQKFCEKKLYSISYIWKATKSGSAPIFWWFQLFSPLPTSNELYFRTKNLYSWFSPILLDKIDFFYKIECACIVFCYM